MGFWVFGFCRLLSLHSLSLSLTCIMRGLDIDMREFAAILPCFLRTLGCRRFWGVVCCCAAILFLHAAAWGQYGQSQVVVT